MFTIRTVLVASILFPAGLLSAEEQPLDAAKLVGKWRWVKQEGGKDIDSSWPSLVGMGQEFSKDGQVTITLKLKSQEGDIATTTLRGTYKVTMSKLETTVDNETTHSKAWFEKDRLLIQDGENDDDRLHFERVEPERKGKGDEGDQKTRVSKLWKTFTSLGADEVSAITVGVDGRYLVIGNTPLDGNPEFGRRWWGELNANGEKVRETKNWKTPGFLGDHRVVALTQTSDKSIWIVGTQTVSKFSDKRTLVFSKSVIGPMKRSVKVCTAIGTDDGGLILAGAIWSNSTARSEAWIMAIDKAGNKVWENIFDYGEDELIVSGVRSGKDQYVFAAILGKPNKFGAGHTGVRVIQCTGLGKKTGEYVTKGAVSPGRMAKIAVAHGRIVLAYSKAPFPMRDAWLLCLDSKLKKLWERNLSSQHITSHTPAVATTSAGTFTVTWDTNDVLMWQLDKDGKKIHERTFGSARGFYVPEKTGGRLFLQKIEEMEDR